MKIATLILISIFFFATLSYAHPPKNIEALYDKDKNVLKIKITHPVRNNQKHFVSNVKILQNGIIISDTTFTSQTNNKLQSIEIKSVDLKPEDKIIIKAKCNKYGTLKKSIRL